MYFFYALNIIKCFTVFSSARFSSLAIFSSGKDSLVYGRKKIEAMQLEPDRFKRLEKNPFLSDRSMVKEKKKRKVKRRHRVPFLISLFKVYVKTSALVNGI